MLHTLGEPDLDKLAAGHDELGHQIDHVIPETS